MMTYERRLSALARQAGVCLRHKGRLVCHTCTVSPPMPEALAARLDALVNAIADRVGGQGLDDALRRGPKPPAYAACAHCGMAQTCHGCTQDYGQALFDALDATPTERATMSGILADARKIDREWRRPWA